MRRSPGKLCYDDSLRRDLSIPYAKRRDVSQEAEFKSQQAALPNKRFVRGHPGSTATKPKEDGVEAG